MDLSQWTENAVKGESKKKVRLDTEQIEKAADIYHTWQFPASAGISFPALIYLSFQIEYEPFPFHNQYLNHGQ